MRCNAIEWTPDMDAMLRANRPAGPLQRGARHTGCKPGSGSLGKVPVADLAERIGVSVHALYARMEKLGLPRERRKPRSPRA